MRLVPAHVLLVFVRIGKDGLEDAVPGIYIDLSFADVLIPGLVRSFVNDVSSNLEMLSPFGRGS
jgi:hypothetical protein